jgi:hypothetical protein
VAGRGAYWAFVFSLFYSLLPGSVLENSCGELLGIPIHPALASDLDQREMFPTWGFVILVTYDNMNMNITLHFVYFERLPNGTVTTRIKSHLEHLEYLGQIPALQNTTSKESPKDALPLLSQPLTTP